MIVVCAPSRSSRSAMYIPIFARPPVSSARRPRQVGARVAAGVVAAPRRSGRAGGRRRRPRGSAACRRSMRARGSACRRGRRPRRAERAARAVSSSMRPGAPVAVAAVTASSLARTAARRVRPAPLLDRLVEPAGGAPHGDRVRMLGRQPLDLREDAERIGEAIGVDAVHGSKPILARGAAVARGAGGAPARGSRARRRARRRRALCGRPARTPRARPSSTLTSIIAVNVELDGPNVASSTFRGTSAKTGGSKGFGAATLPRSRAPAATLRGRDEVSPPRSSRDRGASRLRRAAPPALPPARPDRSPPASNSPLPSDRVRRCPR